MGPALLLRPDVYRGVERRKCTDGGVEIQKSLVSSNGMQQNVTVAFLIGRILWGTVAVIWFVQNEIIQPCFDSSVVANQWTRLTSVRIRASEISITDWLLELLSLLFGYTVNMWDIHWYNLTVIFISLLYPMMENLTVRNMHCSFWKIILWIYFLSIYQVFGIVSIMCLFFRPGSYGNNKISREFCNLIFHSVVTNFIISIISWVKSYKFH